MSEMSIWHTKRALDGQVTDLVAQNWGRLSPEEVLALAQQIDPAITIESLRRRATYLRRRGVQMPRYRGPHKNEWRYWSERDIALLEALHTTTPPRVLAAMLGRSSESVYGYLSRRGWTHTSDNASPPEPCAGSTPTPPS